LTIAVGDHHVQIDDADVEGAEEARAFGEGVVLFSGVGPGCQQRCHSGHGHKGNGDHAWSKRRAAHGYLKHLPLIRRNATEGFSLPSRIRVGFSRAITNRRERRSQPPL
jgi:ribosomal protein L15